MKSRVLGRPFNRAYEKPAPKFRVVNATDDAPPEVFIYDEIGYWGITAQDFTKTLSMLSGDTITLRFNSPGGEVFDGIAMYNAVKAHPAHVIGRVDGLAASAASFILQACDEIQVTPQGTLMIHDAIGGQYGNATEMRKMADELDKVSDIIASIYATRTGTETTFWRDIMRDEAWYNATEAVEVGLADSIFEAPTKQKLENFEDARQFFFRYAGREAAPAPRRPQKTTRNAADAGAPPSQTDTPAPESDALTASTGPATPVDGPDSPADQPEAPEEPPMIDFSALFGSVFRPEADTSAVAPLLTDLSSNLPVPEIRPVEGPKPPDVAPDPEPYQITQVNTVDVTHALDSSIAPALANMADFAASFHDAMLNATGNQPLPDVRPDAGEHRSTVNWSDIADSVRKAFE